MKEKILIYVDSSKRNEFIKAVNNTMQKANELKPNDKYTMISLKELYYKLKMTNEYNEVKAKLDALEQK